MITSVQLFTLALFLLLPLASARAQDALPEGTGKNAGANLLRAMP